MCPVLPRQSRIRRGNPWEAEHPPRFLLDDQRAFLVWNLGQHFGGALAGIRLVGVGVGEIDFQHDAVDADGMSIGQAVFVVDETTPKVRFEQV